VNLERGNVFYIVANCDRAEEMPLHQARETRPIRGRPSGIH